MRFVKPNWNNNLCNVSASLAEYLGCGNKKPVLPELTQALKKGYKNVVFLILDGFGMHPMRKNLAKSAFLRRNVCCTLTSVFPSTTTNATTSFRTNLYPMEHGWFGWSLYFEELKRSVDLFPCVDSHTGEQLDKHLAERFLPAPSYYLGAKNVGVNVVVPPYWEGNEENKFVWRNFAELSDAVEEVCAKAGKQFVYVYCDMPDSVMHRFGVTSEEAKEVINGLDRGVERLAGRLKDTLLVVTADHGQTDVSGAIEIYKDEEILSFLTCPPYLEARATAFKVKRGKKGAFRVCFLAKYGEDFALMESRKLIAENYFGNTEGVHADLLGDFIAVGKTDKIMRLTPRGHDFKGHHTSLTEEEMLVPLILLECGR